MNDEVAARLLALETLLVEVMAQLPREQAQKALALAAPALQRQPAKIAEHSTQLVSRAAMRLG